MILFSNGCSFLTSRPKDGVETANKINSRIYLQSLGGQVLSEMITSPTMDGRKDEYQAQTLLGVLGKH
jgi:hypothetical protein